MNKVRNRNRHDGAKKLGYEPLEPRIALTAQGLVEVGTQPQGALSGQIVYTSGGHGIMANNNGSGSWGFQRPLLLNMVEDLGNQDQMTLFAEYAFRAGATVVPFRPVGHQPNEFVIDNDDVEVTFTGSWNDSTSNVYFGDAGDVPYRFATTSMTETATATYRPNIIEAGFYPVYSWTRAGTDRATDHLYRVQHSGGITEVTVDHTMVGTGLVYLGTYHFEAGTGGAVIISNRSATAGNVVIADMIRFGNGMGDMNRGGGISGRAREDEGSIYWIQWHAEHSQGIPLSSYRASATNADGTANVAAPIRQAAFMNQAGAGTLADRVYVSFHTNAGGGNARGVLALYNGNNDPGSRTPNQFLLANYLGREVNDDLVAQNGQFEHSFSNRSVVTLDRSDIEFGELNNNIIRGEFDATIVEVAFHDNQLDAELLRDPKFRSAAARATLQGVVRYFNDLDSSIPLVMAPGQATGVTAEATGSGSVTVSWLPPAANAYMGDAATGYMVYGSTNGYGFDGGTYVAGGSTTTYTYTGLDVEEGAYYFKVVPVNAGGAASDSEVVAAIPNVGPKSILIVNGFDRLSRQQNPVVSGAERVRPRQSNSFDYVVQVAAAIEVSAPELVVDSASNEAVISGAIDLGEYQAVVWILGEESTADQTFGTVEQSLVSQYLAAGGKLFVSGSEIGFDLDGQNNGREFYNDQLHADYVSDDAGTYAVTGTPGSIFDGLSFTFDNGSQFYNVDFPDVIAPSGGSVAALTYSTGTTAGVLYDGGAGGGQVVMFAFPYETITDVTLRNQVFARVLEFFDFDLTYTDIDAVLDNDDGPSVYTETGTWSSSPSPGFDGGTFRFAPTGSAATASWDFYTPFAGVGEVFVQYRSGVNRASSAAYHIDTGNGIENVVIDQKTNDLTWVSLGTFDFTAGGHTITLDAAASSGGSVVIADVVRIVLPVPGTAPSADFNGDGSVDGRDFLAWQRGFGGTNANPSEGDANNDGNVDGGDLAVWQAQYGTTSPTAQIVTPAAADTVLHGESAASLAFSLMRIREPAALASTPPMADRETADDLVAGGSDEVALLRDWLVQISDSRLPEAPLRAATSQSAEDFHPEFDEVFAGLASDEV